MTDTFDLSELASGASAARSELKETAREGTLAAHALSEAFESAGRDIANSLEGAARSGELSFSALAEQIAQSFAQIALDQFVLQPVSGLLGNAASLLGGVLGQRAEGGPVLAGERYLVGERGPEVFTPSQSGAISALGAAPISITINTQGGPLESVRRSESQIAAAVARAVQRGGRQL
ncbi:MULTISPECIES: phage tail tape measure C-terminal domain-containing protein [unclassified Oceanicaulis]|jgi:phage-related minor tail protein|uniref:phage tail tape measure C-terminal domain-containing protein n=1 Tax=unclassified Oceanicaulis TaxID=2632123 RepID=UPI0025DD28FD|nr:MULTISPECIES: phage tail tape measure C-terminal domain-containing protein [unclassified Oceanicaulis]